jgi:hypothetical protein
MGFNARMRQLERLWRVTVEKGEVLVGHSLTCRGRFVTGAVQQPMMIGETVSTVKHCDEASESLRRIQTYW